MSLSVSQKLAASRRSKCRRQCRSPGCPQRGSAEATPATVEFLELRQLLSTAPALNLLFFGNSFTNNSTDGSAYDMPATLKEIAAADGLASPNVYEQILLGQTLADHLNKIAADGSGNIIVSVLPAGQQWDDVVLQEYSTRPTNAADQEGNVPLFRSDALQLFNEVRANSPSVHGVLYETWARGSLNSVYPTDFVNPADMQNQLQANYNLAAGDLNTADGAGSATISPVGEAWRSLNWETGLYSTISGDGVQYHPSTQGILLNAMVNFETIYHVAISNIPVGNVSGILSNLGLTSSDWTTLGAAADTAVARDHSGALSGSQSSAAASYNLTTLGTADWAHWGRGAQFGAFDHKATGGSQISNATTVGTGGNFGGYSDPTRSVTWTDGTPTSSDANEHGYIWSNGALNTGYSFTVPADTTTRTLTVYAGGINTTSSLTAYLSDGSAIDYVATAGTAGLYTNSCTITYHAASAGQTLTVTLLKTGNLNGRTDGSADLIAAYLTGAPAADTTKPTATLQATPTVTASNSAATLTVVYTDNVAVKNSTLATGNLTLTGPTSQTASFVGSSPSSDNATITATYSVAAPAGGWTTAANGTYTVSLAGSSVSDTSNNFALATSLGSFQIAIPGPDTTLPQATLQATATVTSSASAATLTVVYTDNVAVKNSTLATGNLTLTGPTSQTASFVGSSPSSDNATITATYSVAAPAGGWTTAANGTYTVSLAGSSVSDTSNNFALATSLGSFQIAIPVPGLGSLSGQAVDAAASYNLTTLGTSDWAHWGRASNAGNFDHKATGGSKISNVTVLGAGSHGSWYDSSRSVNWTDGTPTGSDADSAYIWANNAIGAGFSFTAPADTTTRTLYVYAGGNTSGATLTAHLSDGSAADYAVTASGTGLYTKFYTITYKAASAGQTLTISYVKSSNINGNNGGSVDLIAAALA